MVWVGGGLGRLWWGSATQVTTSICVTACIKGRWSTKREGDHFRAFYFSLDVVHEVDTAGDAEPRQGRSEKGAYIKVQTRLQKLYDFFCKQFVLDCVADENFARQSLDPHSFHVMETSRAMVLKF